MLTPTTADLSHNLDSCISNIILPCRCLVSLVKALALLHLIPKLGGNICDATTKDILQRLSNESLLFPPWSRPSYR